MSVATGIPYWPDNQYSRFKIYKKANNGCQCPSCISLPISMCNTCNRGFCTSHIEHTHYKCEYCQIFWATSEILIDSKLACTQCTDHMLITRCCTKCRTWQPENARYCVVCIKKCTLCSNANFTSEDFCQDCERRQRACFTQGISGAYGQFH